MSKKIMIVANRFEDLKISLEKSVGIVIGNFDGIHRGHHHLLVDFVSECNKRNITPVVISFSPHPLIYFQGEFANVLIQTITNKYKLIEILGINSLWEIQFNSDLQNLCAEQFIKNYIESINKLELIYLGHDFALGKGKEDSYDLLKRVMSKHLVEIKKADALLIEGEVCSSTKIRKYIVAGEMRNANLLLGHYYFLTGKVIRGEGLGSKEIVATANLGVEKNLIIPLYGVYFTNTIIKDKTYKSITNIGRRPTIKNNGDISVETHILDFNDDIYDQEIQVDFIKNIRLEEKFESLAALKIQVEKDVNLRREFND